MSLLMIDRLFHLVVAVLIVSAFTLMALASYYSNSAKHVSRYLLLATGMVMLVVFLLCLAYSIKKKNMLRDERYDLEMATTPLGSVDL